jgi:hypothetical protein
MNFLIILAFTATSFAAVKLQAPADLTKACDELEQKTKKILSAPLPPDCENLAPEQKALGNELSGPKLDFKSGVVSYARTVAKRLEFLRTYRGQVKSECEQVGVASAVASTKTKSSSQDKLVGDVAAARQQIGAQSCECANKLVTMVSRSAVAFKSVPEACGQPKSSEQDKAYPLLHDDVNQRESAFSKNTPPSEEDRSKGKNECGVRAREFKALEKDTMKLFDQMKELVSLEESRTGTEAQNYGEKAGTAFNNGKKVKQTVESLTGPSKATVMHDGESE